MILKCFLNNIQGSERIPWGIGKIVGAANATASTSATPSSMEVDSKAHFSAILNSSSSSASVPNPSALVSNTVAKESTSAASNNAYLVSWSLLAAGTFISSLY